MSAGLQWGCARRFSAWGIVVAGSLSLATFVHVIETVSRRLVTYDSVVLWYAAPEWSHLRLHEPGFYGQAYGSTLAAVPMAFLHAVGRPAAVVSGHSCLAARAGGGTNPYVPPLRRRMSLDGGAAE